MDLDGTHAFENDDLTSSRIVEGFALVPAVLFAPLT